MDFSLNLRQSTVGFLNREVTQLNLGLMILATVWGTGVEVERSVTGRLFGLGDVDFGGSARTWGCVGEGTGGVSRFAPSF